MRKVRKNNNYPKGPQSQVNNYFGNRPNSASNNSQHSNGKVRKKQRGKKVQRKGSRDEVPRIRPVSAQTGQQRQCPPISVQITKRQFIRTPNQYSHYDDREDINQIMGYNQGQQNRGNISQHQPSQYQSKIYQKLLPKNVTMGKERMYEQILHLKSVNNLQEENIVFLKTELQSVEIENKRLLKKFSDLNSYSFSQRKNSSRMKDVINIFQPPFNINPKQTFLSMKLKKQLKKSRDETQSERKKVEKYKRNIKLTKIKELEIQLNTFIQETVRLKEALDIAEQHNSNNYQREQEYLNLQQRVGEQEQAIEEFQKDNTQLTEAVQYLEEQNSSLFVRIYVLLNETNEQQKLAIKKKNIQTTKSKRIAKLRQQQIEKLKRILTNKPELKKYSKNELEEVVEGQEQEIVKLSSVIEENNVKFQQERVKFKGEIERLRKVLKQANMNLENQQLQFNNQQYQLDQQQQQQQEEEEYQNQQEYQQQQEEFQQQEENKQNYQEQQQQYLTHEQPKVGLEEIQKTTDEINYRLRIAKIQPEDIEGVQYSPHYFLLFFKSTFKGLISIQELVDQLEKYYIIPIAYQIFRKPFLVRDDEQRLLIARFLVEKNEGEVVQFYIQRTRDVENILLEFMDLIGNYQLLTPEEDQETFQYFRSEIMANLETLQTKCSEEDIKQTGNLDEFSLIQAFELSGIQLDNVLQQWITCYLFQFSNNLNELPYYQLFEDFISDDDIQELEEEQDESHEKKLKEIMGLEEEKQKELDELQREEQQYLQKEEDQYQSQNEPESEELSKINSEEIEQQIQISGQNFQEETPQHHKQQEEEPQIEQEEVEEPQLENTEFSQEEFDPSNIDEVEEVVQQEQEQVEELVRKVSETNEEEKQIRQNLENDTPELQVEEEGKVSEDVIKTEEQQSNQVQESQYISETFQQPQPEEISSKINEISDEQHKPNQPKSETEEFQDDYEPFETEQEKSKQSMNQPQEDYNPFNEGQEEKNFDFQDEEPVEDFDDKFSDDGSIEPNELEEFGF